MPRKFPKRRSNTTPTVMATVSVVFASEGMALVSAAVPAEVCTATVTV